MSTTDSTTDAAPASRLATVQDLREYLHDSGTGTNGRVTVLARMLDAASERINSVRQFYASGPETRIIGADGDLMVAVGDLRVDDDTEVIGDGQPIGRYRALQRRHDQPAHALLLYQPVGTLTITGQWGFQPTPAGIQDACLAWAARGWFAKEARQADVVANEGGQASYFARMPSIVRVALEPYQVPGL